jgi:hypothetical protein
MDNSSFNDVDESLSKTITLPRQAFGGFQESVLIKDSSTSLKLELSILF